MDKERKWTIAAKICGILSAASIGLTCLGYNAIEEQGKRDSPNYNISCQAFTIGDKIKSINEELTFTPEYVEKRLLSEKTASTHYPNPRKAKQEIKDCISLVKNSGLEANIEDEINNELIGIEKSLPNNDCIQGYDGLEVKPSFAEQKEELLNLYDKIEELGSNYYHRDLTGISQIREKENIIVLMNMVPLLATMGCIMRILKIAGDES